MIKTLSVKTDKPAGAAYTSRRARIFKRAIADYLKTDDQAMVVSALDFAAIAHDGQFRKSGKPFIEHPLATATILAEMKLDALTLASALLHDVVEDCKVTFEDLEKSFSPTVRMLVQGVTNMSQLDYANLMDADDGAEPRMEQLKLSKRAPEHLTKIKAYNLRKMFIAMAQDVRVVLVKLADRLHNMQTLRYLSPRRQKRMAWETMDIYAPIAQRLGMATMKWQLEDLSFKYLMPEEYRRVSRIVSRRRDEREDYTRRARAQLQQALDAAGVKCSVAGRPKHLYSIYNKIQRYAKLGRYYNEIYDYVALRIITAKNETSECYRVLDAVHDLWKPIPYQFDDYIASPKENLYQSLHTSVIGPDKYPLEVQIRTAAMHRVAEEGIAAHWSYKDNGAPARRRTKSDDMYDKAIEDLKRNLMEKHEFAEDADEYVQTVRNDYLSGQIFVFTPRGDVIELPSGATPLDFAYKIHTELGHRCLGGKVNGRMTALTSPLKNGDIVEIVRSKQARAPKLDWLNPSLGYLRSDSARSKVKAWFKRQKRQANVNEGRAILERERKRLSIKMTPDEIASKVGFASGADLEYALGTGEVTIERLLEQIIPEVFAPAPAKEKPAAEDEPQKVKVSDIVVMGTKGLYTRIANCCADVRYGESIIGYLTRANGVSIHRALCRSAQTVKESARLLNATWGHLPTLYPSTLTIRAENRLGLIRDITTVLAAEDASVGSLHTEGEVPIMQIVITLCTKDLKCLTRVINRIRMIDGLITISNTNAETT